MDGWVAFSSSEVQSLQSHSFPPNWSCNVFSNLLEQFVLQQSGEAIESTAIFCGNRGPSESQAFMSLLLWISAFHVLKKLTGVQQQWNRRLLALDLEPLKQCWPCNGTHKVSCLNSLCTAVGWKTAGLLKLNILNTLLLGVLPRAASVRSSPQCAPPVFKSCPVVSLVKSIHTDCLLSHHHP